MSTRRLQVEMQCASCGSSSAHEILYVGRLMLATRCSTCGAEVTMHSPHLVQDWIGDVSARLAGKRHTLWSEARTDTWSFARHLPGRLVRQPRKLVDEATAVLARRG